VSILIPRREYVKVWHRLLHDRSSNSIAAALSNVAHCNVTIVPYHLGSSPTLEVSPTPAPTATNGHSSNGREGRIGPANVHVDPSALPDNRTQIATVVARHPTTVAGRVRAIRVQPWGGNPALECSLSDETGSITLVFLGRRQVEGVRLGTIMSATGVAGEHHGMRAILNPAYTLIQTPTAPADPSHH